MTRMNSYRILNIRLNIIIQARCLAIWSVQSLVTIIDTIDQKNEYSKVQRVDVNSEEALLEMVLKKRVNVAIVSRSTTEYLATKNGWKEVFYFSQNPHETYYRAIMAPESLKAEFTLLQHALDSELFKKQLVTLLKSYHLVY